MNIVNMRVRARMRMRMKVRGKEKDFIVEPGHKISLVPICYLSKGPSSRYMPRICTGTTGTKIHLQYEKPG